MHAALNFEAAEHTTTRCLAWARWRRRTGQPAWRARQISVAHTSLGFSRSGALSSTTAPRHAAAARTLHALRGSAPPDTAPGPWRTVSDALWRKGQQHQASRPGSRSLGHRGAQRAAGCHRLRAAWSAGGRAARNFVVQHGQILLHDPQPTASAHYQHATCPLTKLLPCTSPQVTLFAATVALTATIARPTVQQIAQVRTNTLLASLEMCH